MILGDRIFSTFEDRIFSPTVYFKPRSVYIQASGPYIFSMDRIFYGLLAYVSKCIISNKLNLPCFQYKTYVSHIQDMFPKANYVSERQCY